MHPVKLAVIGAGQIGQKHISLIAKSAACQLVAIADSNPDQKAFADQAGVRFYQNYLEMLEAARPEGVIVATSTPSHAEVGIACAERAIPLLIEKPITASLEEGRQLLETAAKHNVHILVGHHRRHNNLVQKARSIVQDGDLGHLISVSLHWVVKKPDAYFRDDWRTKPGGGPVLINLIHEIDTLRYICGEIESVYALTASDIRNYEVEESANVTIKFTSGVLGSVVASDAVPSPWSYEMTTGENPDFYHVDENCCFFFGTQGSFAFPKMDLWHFETAELAAWQHPIQKQTLPVERNDPLTAQLAHFCQMARGVEPPVCGQWGRWIEHACSYPGNHRVCGKEYAGQAVIVIKSILIILDTIFHEVGWIMGGKGSNQHVGGPDSSKCVSLINY